MERNEIVATLARLRFVERLVARITKTQNADTQDLAQMVYEVLLTYRAECIVDLWESGGRQMEDFVARIICNQYFSNSSPFYRLFKAYAERCISLDGGRDDEETDVNDGGDL